VAGAPSVGSSHGRLGVLDGLRGLAVLLVLWYHVWEISWVPGSGAPYVFIPATGYVGVHLFFYLSGFVIAYPFVMATAAAQPAPSWATFAQRRFFKIVPSYVLSIAIAIAIGYAATQGNGAPLGIAIVTHLLFIHTWWDSTFGSLNGVLWTLAVEVEFYAIFPLVWQFFKRAPWATTGAMLAVAYAWRKWLAVCCYSTLFPPWEQNLPGYLGIFALGMLSAHVWVRYGDAMRATRARRALATLVGVGGLLWLVALQHDVYGWRSIDQWVGAWDVAHRPLLGLAFCAAALGSLAAASWWKRSLANPVLIFLAAVSYNLYLYHQMIARELLAHRIPNFTGTDQHADPYWGPVFNVVAFAAAIAFAALVTYGFERPILRWGGKLRLRERAQSVRRDAG
jgi:peptidoglycan/LPS O-acetylase OafA/YrhL